MRTPIKSKRPDKGPILNPRTLPAPVGGWATKFPLASTPEKFALYLDNWWPTSKTVDIRKGATNFATGLPGQVKTVMTWQGPSSSKLFAAVDTGIFDVSAGGDFTGHAADQVCTNGAWESCNINTTGGSFLVMVNGADSLRYFNGTAWTVIATFPISGGGTLTTSTISNICMFKRSLFFLEKGTMNFYYLPIDQINGTVGKFPLGALFDQGGSLNAAATWTIDGGKGVDDYLAFATSEGQVAIYQGTDPSVSTTWALQGVFDLARPLGKRCFIKYGGDLLYLSYLGAAGLSKSLQSTRISMEPSLTDFISEAFTTAATNYGGNFGWQFMLSPNDNILLVNVPLSNLGVSHQYLMNTNTNAWMRVIGWNAYSWTLWNNKLFMGMSNVVAKAWVGGDDFGGPIYCYAKQAFVNLADTVKESHVRLVRPLVQLSGRVSVDVALDTEFNDGTAYGPATFATVENTLFNTARWNSSVWAGLSAVRQDWMTVSANPGYFVAPRLRVIAQNATVSWSAFDVLSETGAMQG